MADSEFIPYARQSITQEDVEAVAHALKGNVITRGPLVEAFEQAVADYCHVKYAVAFSSGSTALLAAYRAADIRPGDKILTTPNSFIATTGSAVLCGATPVFIDIDPQTANIDLDQLKLNVEVSSSGRKTVIAPVHFAGVPVDMEKIGKMLTSSQQIVIEDAAHAIGSRYKDGQMVGCCAWSDMTIFSFHPAKTMTTGEGGMVTTNNPDLYHLLRRFRNNCIERDPKYLQLPPNPWHYEVTECGSNYNFTEMQAALGLSQLKRIDAFISKRQRLVALYKERLHHVKNVRFLQYDRPDDVSPHLCVVRIDYSAFKTTRKQLMESLIGKNIGTQVHYIPIYKHPVFADQIGDISEYFPAMEGYFAECLSLPLYYDLSEEQVIMIAEELKRSLVSKR